MFARRLQRAMFVVALLPIVACSRHTSRSAGAIASPTAPQATVAPSTVPSATKATAQTSPVGESSPVALSSTTVPGVHRTSAPPSRCALGPQAPPRATITASFPTAIAFAPDGRLFFAERAGTIRVWQNGASHVFATVRTMTSEPGGGYSERGLLGLAISPSFSSDHFVYAFYSDADGAHQHVVRFTDCGGTSSVSKVIITLPSGSDCCHKGGRIVFGKDGMLYVTLGDEHSASAAQDVHDVRGKVLRYRPDGTIPSDNPFGRNDPVWAYGFRNPFGIAASATGQIGITSNGPTGDAGSPSTGYDTAVASVARGRGYQWPNCYGYSHPLSGSSCGTGQSGPDWSSESSTVVPTGAAFVDSSGPSQVRGHFVFCTFNSGMLILTPGSPHATVSSGPSECRLDVKQAPDHSLYYSDTGHIYRLG